MYLLTNSNILIWGVFNLMKKIALAAGILLVLTALLSAYDFNAAQDSVSMQCTTGTAFFYTKNTDSNTLSITYSAKLGELTGYFETLTATVAPGQATSTSLYLNAPDDLQGTKTIEVTAQACDSQKCTAKKLTQVIFLTACKNPTRESNENKTLTSIQFTHFDYPTSYSAVLNAPRSCTQVKVGEHKRIKATLSNTGAAATFDLQLAGETDLTNAEISRTYLNLQRNQEKEFYVDVKPQFSGTFYVTVRATQNQGTVVEQDMCIKSLDNYQATIAIPAQVTAKNCQELLVNGTLSNHGTASDFYYLRSSIGSVSQEEIQLLPGERKDFFIWIQNPQPGSQHLEVQVTSQSGLSAKAITSINTNACALPVTVTKTLDSSFSVVVDNTLDTPLEDVTLEVIGLPANWTYSADSVAIIPPHTNKTLGVKITQTTNEEANNAIVIVKSKGREIARQSLDPIKPTTGLFTANISQSAIILGILLVAAAILIWVSRKPRRRDDEKEVRERLRRIREETDKPN